MKEYFVYILANKSKMLYVGVTNNLVRRLCEHKEKMHPKSYTARYNVNRLVYYESTNNILAAINREKLIKHYLRKWKVELIEKENPHWQDLSEDWDEG